MLIAPLPAAILLDGTTYSQNAAASRSHPAEDTAGSRVGRSQEPGADPARFAQGPSCTRHLPLALLICAPFIRHSVQVRVWGVARSQEPGADPARLTRPLSGAAHTAMCPHYHFPHLLHALFLIAEVMQVRVWGVARSQEQILRASRNPSLALGQPGLIAYWKFDDVDTCALSFAG